MKNSAQATALVPVGGRRGEAAAFEIAGHPDMANFPGIALVTDSEGRVVDATEAAAPLATAFTGGAHALIVDMVSRARATGPVSETFILGGSATYGLTVLPLSDGGALVIGNETTLERNLRDALIDSRQRYKDFVQCSSDFAWETDRDGRFVFVSPRGALGYPAKQLTGLDPRELVHEGHEEPTPLPFHSHEACGSTLVWLRSIDGAAVRLDISSLPLFDNDGQWIGVRGVCRDVTEAWRRERALDQARHRERLVAGVVDSIRNEADPEKLLALTTKATREALDASFCAIYRMSEGKLLRGVAYGENIGQTLIEQFDERINWLDSGSRVVELPLDNYRVLAAVARHRQSINGAICVARTLAEEPWNDDDHALIDGVVGQLGIAVEQIVTHDTLKQLSRTDELTGLQNRRAFMECINRRHKHALRTGRTAALLFTDLDNFKMVNDVHGHQRGDEVLIMLAEVLDRSIRETDVTARFGGDEFAVWLDEISEADAIAKATLMIKACEPFAVYSGGSDFPVRLSIGVAAFDPATGEDVEALIARADAAMYTAKHNGKGTYALAPPTVAAKQKEIVS